MRQHNITVIESQLDWLTISKRAGQRADSFKWWADRVRGREEREGGKTAPFALHGYSGERTGRIRYAERDGAMLVQLSGDLAERELEAAETLADNCSRIDLAVTVRVEPDYPGLEYDHYQESLRARQSEGARASSQLVMSSDGGATFYLGKRSSDIMLRVYNKWVESTDPHYRNCHRYELEVKGDRALPTLHRVSNATDRPSYVNGAIRWYCEKHDLAPIFCDDTPVALAGGFRRRSDVDTKLRWLEASVKPTVDWLREFGHQRRVLDALGYSDTPPLGQRRSRATPGPDLDATGGLE